MKIERILETNTFDFRRKKRADVEGSELSVETETNEAVVFHHEDPRKQQRNTPENPEQENRRKQNLQALSESEPEAKKKIFAQMPSALLADHAERVNVIA